jgi:signal transduction histidine kinase
MNLGDDMTLFDNLLLQALFIVSPLAIWMIYQIYTKNLDRKKNNLTFDIALFTMMYFMMKIVVKEYHYILYFTLSIPLILAYVKRRKKTFVAISTISIIYFHQNFYESLPLLLLEYSFCYILYQLLETRKEDYSNDIQIFVCVKSLFGYCYLVRDSWFIHYSWTGFFTLSAIVLIFYFVVFFTVLLLKKSEDVILYSNAVSLLDEEKKLKNSLFKITHEIKNPIAVCKGYLDMFDPENKEHSKKYVPILKEEISKVLNLLQDFLSISKIKVEKEPLDIYYLLENVQNSILPILKEKHINAKYDIPDQELLIDGDYNRLNQVIINIIKNSIEAMQESEKKNLTISTKELKEKIEIVIEDTGVGISKENLQNIKQPFFSTKRSGTGLGVYLSGEIIKAHNGKIKYDSEIGKGTKVKIILPIKKDIQFS